MAAPVDRSPMSADCLFCRIVAGEIPSRTVYEDETALAFLDINPVARGHTLVVPKAHREQIQDLDADEAAGLFAAVSTVAPAVESALDAGASTIGVNNGPESGQEIPHVHVHVVPRRAGDGGGPIQALFGGPGSADDEELDAVAADIEAEL